MQMALDMLNEIADDVYCDQKLEGVIAVLRQALETEQELGTWREVTYDQLMEEVRNRGYEIRDAKITALRQARSLTDELMDCVDRLGSEADTVDPRVWQHLLVYAPEPEQEPVAWANLFDLQNFDMKVRTCPDLHHTVPLYTAPPKRQWVGLTDEERREIFDACETNDRGYVLAMCEAKLKEKNNG